jgi:hypothetical protein
MSDALIARLPKKRAFGVGISTEDIKSIPITKDVKADVLAALSSGNPTDIRIGLFFAEHLFRPELDLQFESHLLDACLKQLHSSEWGIREGCTGIIVKFGRKLDSYRDLMLEALQDRDPLVRKRALTAYHTFAKAREFKPLEAFENDDYLTEVGMGSHLIYEMRNQALEAIEKVIGRNFTKSEKTTVLKTGEVVFWWDWKPFHEWKNSWIKRMFG